MIWGWAKVVVIEHRNINGQNFLINQTSLNEKLLPSKDTARKMNRQTEDWEKIFVK